MKTYSQLLNKFQADVEVFEEIVDHWEDDREEPCFALDLELLWQELPRTWAAFRTWQQRIEKDIFAGLTEVQKDEHRRFRDDFVPRMHRLFDRTKALTDDLKETGELDLQTRAARPIFESFEKARREIVATPVGPADLDPEPQWERG